MLYLSGFFPFNGCNQHPIVITDSSQRMELPCSLSKVDGVEFWNFLSNDTFGNQGFWINYVDYLRNFFAVLHDVVLDKYYLVSFMI